MKPLVRALTLAAVAVVAGPVCSAQNAPRKLWSRAVARDLSRPQTPADYFEGTSLPHAGEIALAGRVKSTAGPRQQMSVSALAFRLPSGRTAAVAGRSKTVILPSGQSSVFYRVGDELVILGPDRGSGHPLPARIIYAGK